MNCLKKGIMTNGYGHITHVAQVPLAKMRMKGFTKVQYSSFIKIKVNVGISWQYLIKLCHIVFHDIIIQYIRKYGTSIDYPHKP